MQHAILSSQAEGTNTVSPKTNLFGGMECIYGIPYNSIMWVLRAETVGIRRILCLKDTADAE